VQAHIAQAGLLVVATPESTDVRPMIETARALNPGIPVIARAANEEEGELLLKEGASQVVHAKGAVTQLMVRSTLDALTSGSDGSALAEVPSRAAGSRAH